MEPTQYIKDMLQVTEDSALDAGVDTVMGNIPIASSLWGAFKMNRVTNALKEHDKQLESVIFKIENSLMWSM
ncbi:hypothetical protein GLW08_12635 [Pontibacillus yanchengensis]|uniref:Uncharacterized protein n=1 Tax=Pontibacillus yanchengensis TaxID=462910 RepID=A0ACC7VJ18_9BACI|nr:hypothetical protein [Pontibacillus yanchengensis]MYL54184.1 hypothetical protein [Pontibacillus yanchengensis]